MDMSDRHPWDLPHTMNTSCSLAQSFGIVKHQRAWHSVGTTHCLERVCVVHPKISELKLNTVKKAKLRFQLFRICAGMNLVWFLWGWLVASVESEFRRNLDCPKRAKITASARGRFAEHTWIILFLLAWFWVHICFPGNPLQIVALSIVRFSFSFSVLLYTFVTSTLILLLVCIYDRPCTKIQLHTCWRALGLKKAGLR